MLDHSLKAKILVFAQSLDHSCVIREKIVRRKRLNNFIVFTSIEMKFDNIFIDYR